MEISVEILLLRCGIQHLAHGIWEKCFIDLNSGIPILGLGNLVCDKNNKLSVFGIRVKKLGFGISDLNIRFRDSGAVLKF